MHHIYMFITMYRVWGSDWMSSNSNFSVKPVLNPKLAAKIFNMSRDLEQNSCSYVPINVSKGQNIKK